MLMHYINYYLFLFINIVNFLVQIKNSITCLIWICILSFFYLLVMKISKKGNIILKFYFLSPSDQTLFLVWLLEKKKKKENEDNMSHGLIYHISQSWYLDGSQWNLKCTVWYFSSSNCLFFFFFFLSFILVSNCFITLMCGSLWVETSFHCTTLFFYSLKE